MIGGSVLEEYYRILGLQEGASKKEVRKAFRILAKKYHPDVNSENLAEENFKNIKIAHDKIMEHFDGTSHTTYNYGGGDDFFSQETFKSNTKDNSIQITELYDKIRSIANIKNVKTIYDSILYHLTVDAYKKISHVTLTLSKENELSLRFFVDFLMYEYKKVISNISNTNSFCYSGDSLAEVDDAWMIFLQINNISIDNSLVIKEIAFKHIHNEFKSLHPYTTIDLATLYDSKTDEYNIKINVVNSIVTNLSYRIRDIDISKELSVGFSIDDYTVKLSVEHGLVTSESLFSFLIENYQETNDYFWKKLDSRFMYESSKKGHCFEININSPYRLFKKREFNVKIRDFKSYYYLRELLNLGSTMEGINLKNWLFFLIDMMILEKSNKNIHILEESKSEKIY